MLNVTLEGNRLSIQWRERTEEVPIDYVTHHWTIELEMKDGTHSCTLI